MKVIVIGGVSAGMSAATKIKEQPDAKILPFMNKRLSFLCNGLPYYVSNVINDDYTRMLIRNCR